MDKHKYRKQNHLTLYIRHRKVTNVCRINLLLYKFFKTSSDEVVEFFSFQQAF